MKYQLYLKTILFLVFPIIYLPIPIIYPNSMGKCGYVVLLMCSYWISEVIHLSVTSLLPLVLFPLLGILESSEVTSQYFNNTNFLFFGGLIIAKSVEHTKLHERIALTILMKLGISKIRLVFGLMSSTWFMSMWFSNVAATAMVYSIAEAIFKEFETTKKYSNCSKRKTNLIENSFEESTPLIQQNGDEFTENDAEKQMEITMPEKYKKGISLAIAYGSSCGGIGTLIGTGPNLVLQGVLIERYGDKTGLNFGSYMLYAIPISFFCLLVILFVISLIFIGPNNIFGKSNDERRNKRILEIIDSRYQNLGLMTYREKACLSFVCTLILLWITRNPGYPIWGQFFQYKNSSGSLISWATDTQPALLISVLLMIWPDKNPFTRRFWIDNTEYKPLLPFQIVQRELNWDVLFLLGGSFALAEALTKSGLSDAVGSLLYGLNQLPFYTLLFVLVAGICFTTEFTSNSATATVLLPILLSLSERLKIHPLYLTLPATVSCSLAFCLPISTPPNAMIYASGRVSMLDMIKTGILLNIFGILIVYLWTISFGQYLFSLNNFPDWAKHHNHSVVVSNS